MANSVYVIGLWQHCHFHHQHCCLCAVILAAPLTGATSYMAHALQYLPHKCMSHNLGVWHINGIWGAHLFMAHVLQQCGKCCSILIFDGYVQNCVVCIWTTIEGQWGISVQCGRHIQSGEYVSNVKYMYTSAPGHIIDCIEFIWNIYTEIGVPYEAHEVFGLGIYTWPLMEIFLVGTYMAIS